MSDKSKNRFLTISGIVNIMRLAKIGGNLVTQIKKTVVFILFAVLALCIALFCCKCGLEDKNEHY